MLRMETTSLLVLQVADELILLKGDIVERTKSIQSIEGQLKQLEGDFKLQGRIHHHSTLEPHPQLILHAQQTVNTKGEQLQLSKSTTSYRPFDNEYQIS